ncbi:hypothetical protein [Mycolicibacterium baixiangningiae]|uniref:hypothetical protein n=1 Tax=Mycolicibacterium baixiangningiae TaxID=2761578 RepID=UPI001D01375A|nr:hypothetical protein [Mycolicibacterium baixiangningiae]
MAEVRKVSSRELLEIREKGWRRRVDVVSLAAETLDDIPQPHREQALKVLGRLYCETEPGPALDRLLRRYPAVHVLSTAGVAAEHYERATFWPKLVDILRIQPDLNFQRSWGEAFLDNLRTLGLPTFEADDDAGTRFVGRILLHCGMPTYCLDDFFRLVSWQRGRTPGLTPEAFVSWAAARAAGPGISSVDMPVQRFVRFGDEFAVDVAERSFELLDALAAGSDGKDVLLPERFLHVARELYDGRQIDQVAHGGIMGSSSIDDRPRLVLDPFGQGVILRLPPVGDAPDGRAVWVVTLGEEVRRVATESLWPGSTEPAPQTDVAITKPVRNASVALSGRDHLQLSMIVVDDHDPLMVFGDDGEFIASGLPLPGTQAWVLFPGDPDALHTTGELRVIAESPLPPGWSGFCLLQVDLSKVTGLSVGSSKRTVRKFDSARIELPRPVQGIRTSTALPVFAELPRISIPQNLEAADWDVTLQDDSSGQVIARHRVSEASGANELWHSVVRPLVGSFTIRVRGPWGRGASRSFTLVEGLAATFSPSWRRFVAGGLRQCSAKVRAADGIELSCSQIEFDERKREHALRVGTRSYFRSIVVTPPHMTVAYQAPVLTLSPSVRPLTLFCEDVQEAPGHVLLDIGAGAEPSLHVIANKRSVQTLAARSGRAGVYQFNLAEIVDTLRDFPQVSLALDEEGELIVATMRPRKLFSGIVLDGRHLTLRNCVAVEGLSAYLFPTRAPWREPTCVPVVDGRVPLPDWLIEAGPIRVMARIEDPWVPLPIPDWPSPGTSRLVEANGWVTSGDSEEVAISKFLAGDMPDPVDVVDFARLWTVRARLGSLALGDRFADIAEAIETEIYGNPAAALAALTGSEAPSETIPSLMIRSGLAWANLAEAHESSVLPWTQRGALPAALLSAADSLWSDEEIEVAVGVCGDAVIGVLDGEDPYAGAGCIDGSAELLDQNPALRDQFIHAARLVPQGLLSADSRVLAAMDLVANRRDSRLEWLTRNARSVFREGERLIRMIGHSGTQRAFDARRHHSRTDGWQVIPAISMALALAARHAARGHAEAEKWMLREQRAWAGLAEVAPQLVTIDLIIAELTVGTRLKQESGLPQ